VSSDAGGSAPGGNVASPTSLYSDFLEIIEQSILPPGQAAALFTANAAAKLRLYPQKGALQPGSDADILITDRDYQLRMVFARGRLLVDRR
jgi:beta-aspartyl-dipeptidase (metallo-type)